VLSLQAGIITAVRWWWFKLKPNCQLELIPLLVLLLMPTDTNQVAPMFDYVKRHSYL
jgi:hypothetical protein